MVMWLCRPVFLSFAETLSRPLGVNVERDFNLRHAARGERNVVQVELPERFVAVGDFALALQDMDGDGRLVVAGGREGARCFGRYRRVFVDDFGHYAAFGFDAE